MGILVVLSYLSKQRQAIDIGHSNITDNDIGLMLFELRENFFTRAKALYLKRRLFQRFFQHPAYGFVIVNHPDTILRLHCDPSLSLSRLL